MNSISDFNDADRRVVETALKERYAGAFPAICKLSIALAAIFNS